MDSSDICGSDCSKCNSEDMLCEQCASGRTVNPNCEYCNKGCSHCPLVGTDEGYDYTSNGVGFGRCEAADCPLECAFDGSCCERCFYELAKDCGVRADGKHKVWTIEKCGHVVCEAIQKHESDPSYPSLREDQCYLCVGEERTEKENIDRKAKKEAEDRKESADAPSIISLLATLTSRSAKAALSKWVEDHPAACQAHGNQQAILAPIKLGSNNKKKRARGSKKKTHDADESRGNKKTARKARGAGDNDSVIDLT